MPKGILLFKWDIRIGIKTIQRLPSDLQVNQKALMQIFLQHEYSCKAGHVFLQSGEDNLVSYYFGPVLGIYCIVVLTEDEDTELYARVINDVAWNILKSIKNDTLGEDIENIYTQIVEYSEFNEEQKLALMYVNEIKRTILDKLGNEGIIVQNEIISWFESQKTGESLDIEEIILGLVDEGFLQVQDQKINGSKTYSLNKKLVVSRDIPSKILENSKKIPDLDPVYEEYVQEVTQYFDKYSSISEDNVELINKMILKKNVYKILNLLREKPLSEEDIPLLEKGGINHLSKVLQDLENDNLVYTFKDENDITHYVLKTDFRVYKK